MGVVIIVLGLSPITDLLDLLGPELRKGSRASADIVLRLEGVLDLAGPKSEVLPGSVAMFPTRCLEHDIGCSRHGLGQGALEVDAKSPVPFPLFADLCHGQQVVIVEVGQDRLGDLLVAGQKLSEERQVALRLLRLNGGVSCTADRLEDACRRQGLEELDATVHVLVLLVGVGNGHVRVRNGTELGSQLISYDHGGVAGVLEGAGVGLQQLPDPDIVLFAGLGSVGIDVPDRSAVVGDPGVVLAGPVEHAAGGDVPAVLIDDVVSVSVDEDGDPVFVVDIGNEVV